MRGGLRRAWVPVLVAVLAAALLLVVYVTWGGPAAGLSDRMAIAGLVLAVVGAVSPVVVWARKQRQREASVSTSAQVDAAADILAVRTSATWSKELVRRGIEAPAPVRVRWRWAGGEVASPEQELASSPARSFDPDPLPADPEGSPGQHILSSGVVTRLHDEVYARLRHGRLVLIGGAGAGKTGAMILLLVEALQYRELMASRPEGSAGVPVPVWLTLGSWNPASQGLREWVVATMARDHPYLWAEEFGPDAIGQLFDTGRIALFLDGLDEMPDVHRGRAVELLSLEAAGLRITVTSRPDQYRALVAGGGQLPDTAVVELHPVSARAAARYLLDGQLGSTRRSWEQVAERLEADPDGVLARTLNTPLTLSLARSAYRGGDPAGLLSPDLSSEQALRGHLLDQVLLTAYHDPRSRAHATYWLGWIAEQMNTQPAGPTRDLRWWDIARWTFSGCRQLAGAALGGLVFGLGTVIHLYLSESLPESLPEALFLALFGLDLFAALTIGLVVALVLGHSGDVVRSRVRRQPTRRNGRSRPDGAAVGLRFGLAAGLTSGLVAGLWYSAVYWQVSAEDLPGGFDLVADLGEGAGVVGLVAGLVFGFVLGRSDRDPRVMALRAPTAQEFRRGRHRIATGGIPAGLGVGLLWFVLFGYIGFDAWTVLGLAFALIFGLLFGLTLWLLSDVWSRPIAAALDVTPWSVYRKDIRAGLGSAGIFAIMGGLPAGLLFVFVFGVGDLLEGDELGGWSYLLDMLLFGLFAGLVVGFVLGLIGGLRNGAAALLLCTQTAFALRGRPVRLIPLLESARERQVLRQAGAVYQFRHADLQDRLAAQHRRQYP